MEGNCVSRPTTVEDENKIAGDIKFIRYGIIKECVHTIENMLITIKRHGPLGVVAKINSIDGKYHSTKLIQDKDINVVVMLMCDHINDCIDAYCERMRVKFWWEAAEKRGRNKRNKAPKKERPPMPITDFGQVRFGDTVLMKRLVDHFNILLIGSLEKLRFNYGKLTVTLCGRPGCTCMTVEDDEHIYATWCLHNDEIRSIEMKIFFGLELLRYEHGWSLIYDWEDIQALKDHLIYLYKCSTDTY